jgi:F-type H+-transporting ATPase subunit delta
VAGAHDQISGVAGRYASALFELAEERGESDAVLAGLKRFIAAMGESADLDRLVRSPVFTADDQANALDALLPRLGVEGSAANLLKLMARNRRLFVAPDVVKGFSALIAAKRGQVTAEVVSAEPLSPTQAGALVDALRGSTGKDIQLAASVDPSLIGGLVVKLGSRMIDTSLKTKLSQLKVALKEVR